MQSLPKSHKAFSSASQHCDAHFDNSREHSTIVVRCTGSKSGWQFASYGSMSTILFAGSVDSLVQCALQCGRWAAAAQSAGQPTAHSAAPYFPLPARMSGTVPSQYYAVLRPQMAFCWLQHLLKTLHPAAQRNAHSALVTMLTKKPNLTETALQKLCSESMIRTNLHHT